MVDMSKTVAPNSDQLNADDLIAGPRTITITKVVGTDSDDQPVSIFFNGDNGKPYKPCKSMRRVLISVWGTDATDYAGKAMTLYNDPSVQFGGMKVGGIRISHMSHIDGPRSMMLTTTRSRRNEYTVKPLAKDNSGQVLLAAQEAADAGREAFTAFWNSDQGKAARDTLAPHMDDLKARVKKAEDAAKPLSQRLSEDKHWTEGVSLDQASAGSPEFEEGHRARGNGDARTTCPYGEDHALAADWLAGWDQHLAEE